MLRKKDAFLHMLCRYWSLKREARRGAPLLKRLHLEPWTASAGGRVVSEEERRMKLEVSRAVCSFASLVLKQAVAYAQAEGRLAAC